MTIFFFFFQAEDGIRDIGVTGVQTCALPILHVFGSASVEAAYVADTLRRAHLVDGVAWSEMAVVVRTALAIGPLRRALTSAGGPVEGGAEDLPLAAPPAGAPLLAALTPLLPQP